MADKAEWEMIPEPDTLRAEYFGFEGDNLRLFEDFSSKLAREFCKVYGDVLDRSNSDRDPADLIENSPFLPKRDRDQLVRMFQFGLNNVGNPDGQCRYGINTRGFEMKLLNSIFIYLNLKPYGLKYKNNEPDPSMTFGYFTLGEKESTIWAVRCALQKYDVKRSPGQTTGLHAIFPSHRQEGCANCLTPGSHVVVEETTDLLSVEQHPVGTLGEMVKVMKAVLAEHREAQAAQQGQQDESSTEGTDCSAHRVEEPCFFVTLPAACGCDFGANCPDVFRKHIRKMRKLSDRVFIHLQAHRLDDVLRFGQGYNLLSPGAKYYIYPPMPNHPQYGASENFYVDTISVAKMSGSIRSGLLITTVGTQEFFSEGNIPYIAAHDSTVVGSSNGHFLLFDHYFYSRFPISVISDMKALEMQEFRDTAGGNRLQDYIETHPLSGEDHRILDEFHDFLIETRRLSIGYPVNSLWADSEECLRQMHTVMMLEKMMLNLELPASKQFDIDTVCDENGTPYARRFVKEATGFYKKALFPSEPERYCGMVTTGGTEGMYTSMFLASKRFAGSERAVCFATQEAHYCVPKAASVFGFDLVEVAVSDPISGDMDIDDLHFRIQKECRERGVASLQVVVALNVSSTMKGSTDSLTGVNRVLNELGIPQADRFLICDCACQGNYYPFLPEAKSILPFMHDTTHPDYVKVHGVCISGHKFLGTPFPCGVVLVDLEAAKLGLGKDLPDAEVEDAWNNHGTIVTGARNAYHAASLWKRVKEAEAQGGLRATARNCEAMASYAYRLLKENKRNTGVHPYRHAMGSNIITLRPAPSRRVLDMFGLPESDNHSHFVVMPHVSKATVDALVREMGGRIPTDAGLDPTTPLAED
eukprot:TRINITY_DN5841_c2_g1_i1.p1 TRINITY_DN5841_c2_g1~~TRINITY_DN5841_c2_g1_i1.p1  ORF type:complete len:869 (+),score=320.74 TRINITY_DN5841_c2_g1_i1:78-2684(+)